MKLKTVDIRESDAAIHECLHRDQIEGLVITKDGKPYAAVVPLGKFDDLESVSLALNPEFMGIIEESRRRLKEEGGIPLEEIEARFAEDKAARPSGTRRRAS